MKKLLAVLIAVAMIASAIPVAFAAEEECEHRFDNFIGERPNVRDDGYCYCSMCGVKSANLSGVVEVFFESVAVNFSVYDYEADVDRGYIMEVLGNVTDELYYVEEGDDFFIGYATEKDQSEIDSRVKNAKLVLDEFKKENYAVVYDATELAEKYITVQFQAQWFGGERNYFGDFYNEMMSAMADYEKIVEKVETGVITGNYEECAKEADKLISCLDRQILCLSGNHTFGEYTDNGDGTSTAKCEYCTTTDTVEVEKKDILDILSADLVELMKMLFALVKSFIETVFA